tara:strand:- start:429 stop:1577 length:1149 start_codon:yes stop_codon:yes gene_type:complete
MKVNEILVGSKKRKSRDSRKHRIIQKDLYKANLKENARIQHLEDLILRDGVAGGKKAISTLHQVEKNPGSVTIKWDGRPAIVFGRNEKGEFVLTDKSGFGAVKYDGKVTSPKGLENMIVNRNADNADFAKTMSGIWGKVESTVPDTFRGYVIGDLLWMKKPTATDNKITIMPNTTKYEVIANSDIGKKILASEVGVVIHKAIGLDGSTSDVDMGQFQQGATMIMPPVTMQKSPGIDIPQVDELENYLNQNAKAIDDLFNVPADLKMKNFGDILYQYINASVKNKSLDNLGANFVQWVEGSNLSAPKKERLLNYVNTKAKGFNATFSFIKGIKNVKNKVIDLLDNQKADIQAVQDGEGYVVDKDVKLVNRSTFSQANFARNNP